MPGPERDHDLSEIGCRHLQSALWVVVKEEEDFTEAMAESVLWAVPRAIPSLTVVATFEIIAYNSHWVVH